MTRFLKLRHSGKTFAARPEYIEWQERRLRVHAVLKRPSKILPIFEYF
jgi:hypothetical protein